MNYSPTTGSIKYFNKEKGYGYIYRGEDIPDIFFHIRQFDFYHLNKEVPQIRQKVTFEVAITDKGFQAVNIELMKEN